VRGRSEIQADRDRQREADKLTKLHRETGRQSWREADRLTDSEWRDRHTDSEWRGRQTNRQ
jgi:hypothetical protein